MCADWEREKKCYTVLLCPDCPQLVQVLLFRELEETSISSAGSGTSSTSGVFLEEPAGLGLKGRGHVRSLHTSGQYSRILSYKYTTDVHWLVQLVEFWRQFT